RCTARPPSLDGGRSRAAQSSFPLPPPQRPRPTPTPPDRTQEARPCSRSRRRQRPQAAANRRVAEAPCRSRRSTAAPLPRSRDPTLILPGPVRRPTADLMLLGTVSLWALNFTVSKYILDHGFRPLAYSAVRYACAAVIFGGIALAWKESLGIRLRELPLIVFATLVLFANQLSFVYALRFTTATTVALLFGTLPIFTALFARGSGVEHLSARFWA